MVKCEQLISTLPIQGGSVEVISTAVIMKHKMVNIETKYEAVRSLLWRRDFFKHRSR